MKKLEAKSLIEELKKKTDRKKTSIYVSDEIWAKFKKACKSAPPSVVLERLMLDFIETLK